MTITRLMLDTELSVWFRGKRNTEQAKDEILKRFAKEPGDGSIWSEQDIWEQARKIIEHWNRS